MTMRKGVVAVVAATVLTLLRVDGAQAADSPDCTRSYLLCLNEASQESGFLWRTAMEVECGLGYFGCLRSKVEGS